MVVTLAGHHHDLWWLMWKMDGGTSRTFLEENKSGAAKNSRPGDCLPSSKTMNVSECPQLADTYPERPEDETAVKRGSEEYSLAK